MADQLNPVEFRVFLHNGHNGKVHLLFCGRPSDVAVGMESAMRSSVPFKLSVIMAVSDLLEQSHPILSDDLAKVIKQMIPELEAINEQKNYFTEN